MKKILLFSIVATLILSSCGKKHKVVELNSEADSTSYMLGYLSGSSSLNYITNMDSTKVEDFKDGVKEGLEAEELSQNEIMALSFANFIYSQYCKNGFVFGDSTLVADFNTIKEGAFDALDKKEYSMALDSIFSFLNDIMRKSMQKETITSEELNTLNYVIGYANIKNSFDQGGIDGTPEEIEKFKNRYNEVNQDNSINKFGFIIGYDFKENVCNQPLFDLNNPCNLDLLKAGLLAAFDQDTTTVNPEKCNEYIQSLQMRKYMEAEKKKAEENKILYGDNIEKGENFLAENGKREGVVTTTSGLQYEIIKKGNGATPTANDKVRVHYHGTLIDGTVFDSSIDRGEPAEFGVSQVIKGWTEALQLMPVGSKWKLYIPYDLAYGDKEVSEEIKPYSTLIFEVELLDIVK